MVSVVDVVISDKGHKKYMLSQSYMPAQEQHILLNPKGGLWYDINLTEDVKTPQYTFKINELRRFKNLKLWQYIQTKI